MFEKVGTGYSSLRWFVMCVLSVIVCFLFLLVSFGRLYSLIVALCLLQDTFSIISCW